MTWRGDKNTYEIIYLAADTAVAIIMSTLVGAVVAMTNGKMK